MGEYCYPGIGKVMLLFFIIGLIILWNAYEYIYRKLAKIIKNEIWLFFVFLAVMILLMALLVFGIGLIPVVLCEQAGGIK